MNNIPSIESVYCIMYVELSMFCFVSYVILQVNGKLHVCSVSDFLQPMDCSPPGSSVPGISQAIIQEWVAISSSRGPSWPRNWTRVSCISSLAGGFFTIEPLDMLYDKLGMIISYTRRRQWHPTPVLLPGKSHGRRNLLGCSPWGR